jgi:hypothetical protein
MIKLDGSQNAIILADGTAQSLKLKVDTANTAWTLTFPASPGTSGQVLQTDGAGNLSWGGGGGGGTPGLPVNSIQFNNAGAFGGDSGLTYNPTTNVLSLGSSSGGGIFQIFNSAGTFSTVISSGTSTANWQLTLPPTAGLNGQVLTTNGSGITSWSSAAGSIPVSDDNTTAADEFPLFTNTAGGAGVNLTQAYTASTEYTFNPGTGNLTAPHMVSSTGIFLNANTIATSYTIPAGFNGLAAGTITFAAGATVTAPPGTNWVIV